MTSTRDDGWALVRAVQGGDPSAFARLYENYRDDVRRFSASLLPDRHLAQDISSETFVRAFRGIASVTERGSDVRAWLFTITRNLVRDHRKSKRYRSEIVSAEGWQDTPDPSASPESTALEQDRTARLRAAMAKLPPEQCRCLELRFLKDFSVPQTALAMSRSTAAVKALQYRALRQLAGVLPADFS